MRKKNGEWEELEQFFAIEVVRRAKKRARRWFIAWLATFVVLVIVLIITAYG
nr:MAG TPA: hypothetical protein [Bacteriophage sp.]